MICSVLRCEQTIPTPCFDEFLATIVDVEERRVTNDGCEMIKLSPEESENLRELLLAIGDHHDECVRLCLTEDWTTAGYHDARAEWARDLADYVDCHRAVGTIDLSELVDELREHRKRILRDVEVLKQRAESCEKLERRFNEEQ